MMTKFRNRSVLSWPEVYEEIRRRRARGDEQPIEDGDDMNAEEYAQQLLQRDEDDDDMALLIQNLNSMTRGGGREGAAEIRDALVNTYINEVVDIYKKLAAMPVVIDVTTVLTEVEATQRDERVAVESARAENRRRCIMSSAGDEGVYNDALVNMQIDTVYPLPPLPTAAERAQRIEQQLLEENAWGLREEHRR